jgi:NADPH:quinone reductase-like Zn-dependent oxidoreductase
MKAAVFHEFGGPEVFRYEEVPTPAPGPGEVVVKVAACGINRYDLYMRTGAVFTDIEMPHIVGADVAGTIAAIGPDGAGTIAGVGSDVAGTSAAAESDVVQFKEGDKVIVAPGYPIDPADWDIVPENMAPSFEVTGTHTQGGYAEFIRVPARFVLRDDTGLPAEQVAAMPLVLMTAMHAVETLGEVRAGQAVLVQAGASGSGNACVQVAKALGARVASTVGSAAKFDMVKASGAELVINYNEERFTERVLDWTNGRGVDVVIDNVGASVFENNLNALRVGGTFVNFGLVGGIKATLNIRNLFFRQHVLKGSFMGSMDELRRGLTLLRDGKVKAYVDKTYPLKEAVAAHRYIESRAVKGKVVLAP